MKARTVQMLVVLPFLSFLFVISSCIPQKGEGGSDAKTTVETVSITLGTFSKAVGNSPYHIAKHFGWFEKEPALNGAKLTYKEYNDRPTISSALDSGELQVLFSAEVPAILCRAQGNDLRIVAISANVGQNILVRSALPIRNVPDLRGHSLAILQGTSSHFCLLKILKAAGMTEKDVKLQYMPPAEAKVAFETGKIDAWAVWAPFVEQQEVSGRGKLLLGGDAIVNSSMSVSNRLLSDNEPAVRALVSVIQKAKDWIGENPVEAQKIIAEELGLDPTVVKAAWRKHNWAARLDDRVIKDIQEKATFLAAADKTRSSKKLDVRSELVDVRFAGAGAK